MTFVLLANALNYVFGILMFLSAVFLILLVLVQRGRGGGLTGALGGMGGQSAFGAKAGDVFTRVTMVTAAIWILLSIAAIKMLGSDDDFLGASSNVGSGMSAPDTSSEGDKDFGDFSEPISDEDSSGGDEGAAGGGIGAPDAGQTSKPDSSESAEPKEPSGSDDS
jgi:preprotein translocase subunit SecG